MADRARRRTRRERAPRRWHRLGLRARITLSFALGALALCVALATTTYLTASSSILHQNESSIEHTVYANAIIVRSELRVPSLRFVDILTSVDTSSNSRSLLYIDNQWYGTALSKRALPLALRDAVLSGGAAEQIFEIDGAPHIAVGVPIPAFNAAFFEVFSLDQVSRTLQILIASLAVAAVATTLAGAILGRWAAGNALRPLRRVATAARAIASGRLDTRLEIADVSDLAVLASSFNRMVDRLQQRIERDARFASDVSHELRSPLTTLTNSLSVLEARRDELPERSRQALDLLSDELRRFREMVRDLLEISRLDAGADEVAESLVGVGELVRRSVAAAGDAVPIEIAPELDRLRLVVDKRRFERIVANLVENARRHAGGATRVLVTGRDGFIRVVVEDAGPGVPAGERERVFDRFARGTAAAGRRGAGGGTGLGLALVAEHLKLLGGRIWIEDRPGGGSRFVVELPRTRPGTDLEDVELGADEALEDEPAAATTSGDQASTVAPPAAPGGDTGDTGAAVPAATATRGGSGRSHPVPADAAPADPGRTDGGGSR